MRRLLAVCRVLFHGEHQTPALGWEWVDFPEGGWGTAFLLLPPSVPSEQMPLFAQHVVMQLSAPEPRVVALPQGSKLVFKREPKKE